MPKYKIDPNLQATFVNHEYNIKGEPGSIIETDIFLPNYLPLELIDENTPPAITDESFDITLPPNSEYIVNLTKYHKRIQISLISVQNNDKAYIYLDDEKNHRVVIDTVFPDYIKEFIYYTAYKVKIKASDTNTNNIVIRIHLEIK